MKYVREFIDLRQDSSGFENSRGTIFGNCKFQVLNDKIKIKATLNNIKTPKDNQRYSLHFISVGDEEAVSVKVGHIEVSKDGRGSLESTLLCDSDKGEVIKDFNVIAVILEENGQLGKLVTPAMGYRGQKVLWRTKFVSYDRQDDNEEEAGSAGEQLPYGQPGQSPTQEQPGGSGNEPIPGPGELPEEPGVQSADSMRYQNRTSEYKKFQVNYRPGEDNQEEDGDVVEDNTGISDVLPDDTGDEGVEGIEIEMRAEDDIIQYDDLLPKEENLLQAKKEEKPVTSEEVGYELVPGQENDKRECDFDRKLRQFQQEGYHVVSQDPPVVKREIPYDRNSGKGQYLQGAKEIEEANKEAMSRDGDLSHYIGDQQQSDTKHHFTRFSRKVDEMFTSYPKLTPFKEGDDETWIRIEPRDMSVFPVNTWKLINNPFLMSGYFKHHHLLLGEKVEDGKAVYMVAVPAQYNSREKRIAGAYGFGHFRTCKDITPRTGEFGYWVKQIF